MEQMDVCKEAMLKTIQKLRSMFLRKFKLSTQAEHFSENILTSSWQRLVGQLPVTSLSCNTASTFYLRLKEDGRCQERLISIDIFEGGWVVFLSQIPFT